MYLYQSKIAGDSVGPLSFASRYLLGHGRLLALLAVLLFAGVNGTVALAQDSPVNINIATAEALSEALSGIGLAKAYRIVEYREAHGPFESVDELVEVRGIGKAILSKNEGRIVLQ